MARLSRPLLVLLAAAVVAIVTAACGQSNITVPHTDASYQSDYAAAQLFRQRCAGCHTLASAASYGSGSNPREYLAISGPNFNQRCERPVTRVLYAIENGGFSGAYMPANIVVGQQARQVAEFVSRFAGRSAPIQPGTTPCQQQPMGQLPATLTGGVALTASTPSKSTVPGTGNTQGTANSQGTPLKNSGQGTSTSPILTGTSTAVNQSNSSGKLSKKKKSK